MKLSDKHMLYEKNCEQLFVGQKICAVIYGELKYTEEDENTTTPEPYYKSKYPDVDTLDYSIYFKTDNETICTFWDNTFISYGLKSIHLELTETTNPFEQKWDVSTDIKWFELIGQKIVAFKIIWQENWTSNLDGSNKVYTTYPQTFEVEMENKKTIIISAAEFKGDEENEVYLLTDNLLVTTNIDLARKLKLIE